MSKAPQLLINAGNIILGNIHNRMMRSNIHVPTLDARNGEFPLDDHQKTRKRHSTRCHMGYYNVMSIRSLYTEYFCRRLLFWRQATPLLLL